MHGWLGRILHIDLDRQSSSVETPSVDIYHRFIGGKGLAGYYLSDHITKSWDSPEMPLCLATGPLVGTASPTSGRMTFASRSPLTGTVGDTSVGGKLGTTIKKAGYDAIIITGAADSLIGVEVNDTDVAFADATHLAGKTTSATAEHLDNKGSFALVGPAAENGVKFACIMIDGHFAAGRNGLGLVFATKNLKYITVKGSGSIPVHDLKMLTAAREDIFRQIAASPILLGELGITNFGTGALYDLMDSRRMMPTENFRKTHFNGAPDMNASAYKKRYAPKKAGCQGCHILCKRKSGDGSFLPEFETMSHFSALLDNRDIDTVVRANGLCNELGIDTMTAAATLSCFSEISGEHLSPKRILSLLEDIGYGRGIGSELREGSREYARSCGRSETSMSVKGQELAAYDPRGAYGMALAYATSTRGGCHLRAYPIGHEIIRKPVATDRFSFSGKARIIKIAEDLNAVVDSLTACKFVFFATSLEEYAKVYTAVTGIQMTAQDLLKTGERIFYHDRIMNSRNGFSAKDDDLPLRFFEEGGSSGNNIELKPINRDDFLEARDNYYKVRGLSPDGIPTATKAEELGLEL